jgi:hypothetical protein
MKTLLEQAKNAATPYVNQIKHDDLRKITASIFDVENPDQEDHAGKLAKTCAELKLMPSDYVSLLENDEVAAYYVLEAVNAAHRVFHAPELETDAFFMNWLPSLCKMATAIKPQNSD